MKRTRRLLAFALAVAGGCGHGLAQSQPRAVAPSSSPSSPAPFPGLAATPAPSPAAPDAAVSAAKPASSLSLSAVFSGDGKPIRSGLTWRIFADDEPGRPKIVAKSAAAAPSVTLPAGRYTVHVAYGFASATRRVDLTPSGATERIAVGAGALRLGGAIGDVAIGANRLLFSIYLPVGNDSEGRLIAKDVKAGEVVGLPEGSYHVVSTYGESNAVMRVDLRVDAGKLTDATVNHRAATVTLKLVAAPYGEAFAGTAFSVLTPGGDVIREAIGAFPSMTLAEGDYVAIARHDGSVYTRDFKVESGLDRDIEVLAKSP